MCPRCGSERTVGGEFCAQCGTPIPRKVIRDTMGYSVTKKGSNVDWLAIFLRKKPQT